MHINFLHIEFEIRLGAKSFLYIKLFISTRDQADTLACFDFEYQEIEKVIVGWKLLAVG